VRSFSSRPLQSAFDDNDLGLDGITLLVFGSNDDRLLEANIGASTSNTRFAVASASKLVSALALMRLVDQGALSLTSTSSEALGWSNSVTLDQLGAFVSGIPRDHSCTLSPTQTLGECVEKIEQEGLVHEPGAQFNYGGSHLQVAGRMAEAATSMSWQQVVDTHLLTPLGVANAELHYATLPRQDIGSTNPLVAGGLRATANEYAPLLALLFHKGTVAGEELIAKALMERFFENHYIDATIGVSPAKPLGLDYRYGFGSWLDCDGAVATCDHVSSPGAFGFNPWVDLEHGYYAILAMEADGGGPFSIDLREQLKPLIAEALAP
jgi:CubicO group peptidase (beta-lactamase class C family)